MTTRFVSLLVPAFALSVAATAHATPNFPDFVKTTWDLPSTPDCTLCHSTASGGTGTVTQPFGAFLRSRGAQAYDTGSLGNALAADRQEAHDSDGDGVSDYDELKAGRNPNVPDSAGGGGAATTEAPAYGCGAQVAPARRDGSAGIVAMAAGLAFVIARRKRRAPGR